MDTDRLNALLSYCRIDDPTPEDTALLGLLDTAAQGYMSSAGIAEPALETERRAQYDICRNALVLDWWDRRCATVSATAPAENPIFRLLINQLKFSEPVPDSGTGTSAGGDTV